MKKSVLLAMSGGIDSSAAAVLLRQKGYMVHGLTFIIKGVSSYSIENASKICRKLDISHEYVDITEKFNNDVIEYFKESYSIGLTPNPCIMCNKKIKFGYFYKMAMEKGYDFLSTGHYASIVNNNGHFYLEKSVDETRDQTYFLYVLKENQLEKLLFPLNGVPKSEARKICAENELMPAESKESREICFVPDDYKYYLQEKLGIEVKKGNFIDINGKIIGKHEGIHRYTIGQRRGLGLNMGKPVFVTNINSKNQDITVGDEEDLYTNDIFINNINLINNTLHSEDEIYVKIRYGSTDYKVLKTEFSDNDNIKIKLSSPARAVSPGQSAVLYTSNRVIGGGIIIQTGG